MIGGVRLVAEVKTKSPFGFVSKTPKDEQLKLAKMVGDIVSIHTGMDFGGSFRWLRRVIEENPNTEILAKGMHREDRVIKEIARLGADHILVFGKIPRVHEDLCWVEPLDLAQLKKIPKGFKVMWNARNFGDQGRPKKETFEQARDIWDGWLCQASFIRSVVDIKPGADAVLVGENLVGFSESLRNGTLRNE